MSQTILTASQEYTKLFFLNLKVKWTDFKEYLYVVGQYYADPAFLKIDAYLVFSYLFNNPFGISKRFLISKGETEVHTYGETPLSTLEQIAQECRLSYRDRVFELGCGRGRTCFWLNHFIGCSVVGVDYVPEFIHRAYAVKMRFKLPDVQFRLEDFRQTDLTGATVIYLYGTCLEPSTIEALIQQFSTLPTGTKIITVSYPLTDYMGGSAFEVLKRFPARFTWGAADVYLQAKK